MQRQSPQYGDNLQAFIKTAQYLAGLTTTQDLWTESVGLLVNFWGADLAAVGEFGDNRSIVVQDFLFREEMGRSLDLADLFRKDISEVIETGFLSSRIVSLADKTLSLVFLPVTQNNRVAKVLLVGHVMTESLPKDLLNSYLAVAGLVATTASRLASEAELKKHRKHLQELVEDRTVQLTRTNEQLLLEINERRRAEERTEHLNLVLQAIRNVDQLIVKERDSDRLVQRICDNLIDSRGYYCAWILIDESREVFLATSELDSSEAYSLLYEKLKRGDLPECAKMALKRPAALVVDHSPSTCEGCPMARGHCGRGGLTARLEHAGKFYGLMAVSLPIALVGDREEQSLLEDVAGDIALALHDIELEKERELLRIQLVQAQKAEAVGTLTGGIAHDFNNLFTIINGYAELILGEVAEDDPLAEDLQKILETGQKGAELIQRLLALSKKGDFNPRPLNLNSTVENAANLMRRTFPKMIEIEAILEDNLRLVNADAGQLEQVFMNMCINSKEAMPEGGRITITTRNVSGDGASGTRNRSPIGGRHVLVEIADSGAGMSVNTIDRMFDPFFTSKGWDFTKGTGLGLSVAKGIVERHGGWITCLSEIGSGSKFGIYLPALEESQEIQSPEPVLGDLPGPKKVLVVDDEEHLRSLGKRILERAGYTAITAGDGIEALEIYRRERPTIALVVLDLIMPRMSGGKCIEELLKIDPHLKVVFSTGHSLSATEHEQLGARAKGFVTKPYQVKEFLEVIKSVLAGS